MRVRFLTEREIERQTERERERERLIREFSSLSVKPKELICTFFKEFRKRKERKKNCVFISVDI